MLRQKKHNESSNKKLKVKRTILLSVLKALSNIVLSFFANNDQSGKSTKTHHQNHKNVVGKL